MLLLFLASQFPSPYELTDTTILELPINCVLIGQQDVEQGGFDIEESPPNYKMDTVMSSGWGGRLSDSDSTFTTRTDNKGYD